MTSLERLKPLATRRDILALRCAMKALCGEFGEVTRLDILTVAEARKRRALCLVRLDSAAHEAQLILDVGAARFGDDLLVIVDLCKEDAH
jgi:hypothetical protein